MKLQTERLTLSTVTAGDIENIHALLILAETDRYNTLGIPQTIDETKEIMAEWIKEELETPAQRHTFLLENNEGKFVGVIGMRIGKPKYSTAEIWYKLHLQSWNQGYATEAVKKLLEYGFTDMKLHRIEAGCATENIASGKVLLKTGFQHEGTKRKILPIRGEWYDACHYAILEEDYRKHLTTNA